VYTRLLSPAHSTAPLSKRARPLPLALSCTLLFSLGMTLRNHAAHASPATLAEAKQMLAKDRLVDVLTLCRADEGHVSKSEAPQAAKLLTQALEKAVRLDRPELALQLAEASFEHDAAQPRVLELLGAWALEDGKVATARRYAEIWVGVAPGDDRARAFQAKASAAGKESSSLWATIANIFRGNQPGSASPRAKAKAQARTDEVVIYTTSWCPACKMAKAWLKKKGVGVTEKDLEREPEARGELTRKSVEAGFHERGVPVLDAYGQLTDGFSADTYAELLNLER
jgi:glutaredoxin